MKFHGSVILFLSFLHLVLGRIAASSSAIDSVRVALALDRLMPQIVPTFTPQGVLGVTYGNLTAPLGVSVSDSAVDQAPTFTFTQDGGAATGTNNFVVVMTDVDASNSTTVGSLQYLAANMQLSPTASPNGAQSFTNSTLATSSYVAPLVPKNSSHRILFVLYVQPTSLNGATAFGTFSSESARTNFNLGAFVAAYGLGEPVTATYLLVEGTGSTAMASSSSDGAQGGGGSDGSAGVNAKAETGGGSRMGMERLLLRIMMVACGINWM